jgi:hypothetical protein
VNDGSHAEPFDPLFRPAPEEAPEPPRLGTALGEAVGIWHQRWGTLAAILAVTWVPVGMISEYLSYEVFPEDAIRAPLKAYLMLEGVLGTLGAAAVITLGAGEVSGRPVSFGGAMWGGLRRWLALLVARTMATIAVVLATFALIVPGLWCASRFAFVDCFAVLDRAGGKWPMASSYELSRERFWPCFALAIGGAFFVSLPVVVQAIAEALVPEVSVWWLSGTIACVSSIFSVMVLLTTLSYYHAARLERGRKAA